MTLKNRMASTAVTLGALTLGALAFGALMGGCDNPKTSGYMPTDGGEMDGGARDGGGTDPTPGASGEATPSGNHQLRLNGDDFERARKLIINELSYSPAVNTETELLENLFGEPEQRLEVDANSTYWTYPQRGLAILVNADDKEVFHYVPPRNFEQVLTRINTLRAAVPEFSPEG